MNARLAERSRDELQREFKAVMAVAVASITRTRKVGVVVSRGIELPLHDRRRLFGTDLAARQVWVRVSHTAGTASDEQPRLNDRRLYHLSLAAMPPQPTERVCRQVKVGEVTPSVIPMGSK